MSAHHCYHGMEYTEDPARDCQCGRRLVMKGVRRPEQIAATRIITGTDVDYGALTHHLVQHLVGLSGVAVHYRHRVTGLAREPGGSWRVDVEDLASHETSSVTAKFVFIGAGGGALPLLQKSDIPGGTMVMVASR